MQVKDDNRNAIKQKGRAVPRVWDCRKSKTMLISYMASNELKQVDIAKLIGIKKQVLNNFLHGRILKNSEPQNKLILWLLENNLISLKKTKPRTKCQCPDCGKIHIKSHPFKIKARRGGTGL